MTHRNIIAIGASAGGIGAIRAVLSVLPADLPASIFIVLHIPTHTPTHLAEVLGRHCRLPVVSPVDKERICSGKVYVGVADRHLMIEHDSIRLSRGPKENRFRPAIDVLFRSAAHEYERRVIGVVLSGMLDDGTAGLWAIKDRNGISILQAADEAEFPSMVDSARQYVEIDHQTGAADIGSLLNRLTRESLPDLEATPPNRALDLERRIAR